MAGADMEWICKTRICDKCNKCDKCDKWFYIEKEVQSHN